LKCFHACNWLKCAASTGVGIAGVGITGVGITGVGIAGVGIAGAYPHGHTDTHTRVNLYSVYA